MEKFSFFHPNKNLNQIRQRKGGKVMDPTKDDYDTTENLDIDEILGLTGKQKKKGRKSTPSRKRANGDTTNTQQKKKRKSSSATGSKKPIQRTIDHEYSSEFLEEHRAIALRNQQEEEKKKKKPRKTQKRPIVGDEWNTKGIRPIYIQNSTRPTLQTPASVSGMPEEVEKFLNKKALDFRDALVRAGCKFFMHELLPRCRTHTCPAHCTDMAKEWIMKTFEDAEVQEYTESRGFFCTPDDILLCVMTLPIFYIFIYAGLMSESLVRENFTYLVISHPGYFWMVQGEAGTGKSTLLRELRDDLERYDVKHVVCSLSGISALNVNASTIHSVFGINKEMVCRDILEDPDTLERKAISLAKHISKKNMDRVRENWESEILIFDEHSMIPPEIVMLIERTARLIRVNRSGDLFGRMQVITFGDIAQLPPVPERYSVKMNRSGSVPAALPPPSMRMTGPTTLINRPELSQSVSLGAASRPFSPQTIYNPQALGMARDPRLIGATVLAPSSLRHSYGSGDTYSSSSNPNTTITSSSPPPSKPAPVTTTGRTRYEVNTEEKFIFEMPGWDKMPWVYWRVATLMRQRDDPEFGRMLSRIRKGEHTFYDKAKLFRIPSTYDYDSIDWDDPHSVQDVPIYSAYLNDVVDEFNDNITKRNTNAVFDYPAEYYYYKLTTRGEFKGKEQTIYSVPPMVKDLVNGNTEKKMKGNKELQRAMKTLFLMEGVRVMATENISLEERVANGSTGTVTQIRKRKIRGTETHWYQPEVEFDNGVRKWISYTWFSTMILGQIGLKIRRIPLKIAYASTVHKIQGLTLENGIFINAELFDRVPGLFYVALSRVPRFDLLYMKNFDPKVIRCNRKALDFEEKNFSHNPSPY